MDFKQSDSRDSNLSRPIDIVKGSEGLGSQPDQS